jgi:hypothetical protein
MSVDRPLVRVGVQINNIRALPVEFIVVDEGPAPLLLGSDFLQLLFSIGQPSIAGIGSPPSSGYTTIEPPPKYAPDSVGIRLISEGDSVDTLQLEKFIRAVRRIHNVGVIANSHLHQHEDWPLQSERREAKKRAVCETIEADRSLSDADTLKLAWVETGSIWLSLKTGSKAALSWLAQMFEKSTDARLRATIAAAASAEEDAAIKEMTRDEIARAKTWEQRRLSANHIREAREEWQKLVLSEIDFRKKLAEKIKDADVREQAEQSLQGAIVDLVGSDFMPIVEHIPHIPAELRDRLPVRKRRG